MSLAASRNSVRRAAVATVIGQIPGPAAERALGRLLEDKEQHVRNAALRGMRGKTDAKSQRIFTQFLAENKGYTTQACAARNFEGSPNRHFVVGNKVVDTVDTLAQTLRQATCLEVVLPAARALGKLATLHDMP